MELGIKFRVSSEISVRDYPFLLRREATMLYNEGNNSTETWYKIVDGIVLQSTYQWFGNAVTPSWWTNVWMNAGVAEYLKHRIIDKVRFEISPTLLRSFVRLT